MKKFRFYADMVIEAETLEEAEALFAGQADNFAADAEVEEEVEETAA